MSLSYHDALNWTMIRALLPTSFLNSASEPTLATFFSDEPAAIGEVIVWPAGEFPRSWSHCALALPSFSSKLAFHNEPQSSRPKPK